MSAALGPEGLAPFLLALGMMPRLAFGNPGHAKRSHQSTRLRLMREARAEREAIVAEMRAKAAQTRRLPSIDKIMEKQMQKKLVLARREKAKRWDGPRLLSRAHEKTARVFDNHSKKEHPFPITHAKEFQVPKIDDDLEMNYFLTSVAQNFSSVSRHGAISTQPAPDSSNACFAQQDANASASQQTKAPSNDNSICLTRIAQRPELSEAQQEQMNAAISQEVGGIFSFGALEKVEDESNLPDNASMLNSRFALAIKNENEPSERRKARLAAQGRLDAEKEVIVRDSPTAMKYSARALLAIAAMSDFKPRSRDVKQARLQSKRSLGRDLCARIKKLDKHPRGAARKIIKPIYGIIESGSLWIDARLWAFHNELQMKASAMGPCFLRRSNDQAAEGLAPVIADDTLRAGAEELKHKEEEAFSKFTAVKHEENEINFAGLAIAQAGQTIRACQRKYIDNLPKKLTREMTCKELATIRGKLSWIARSTRPDIARIVAKLAQARNVDLGKSHGKLARKAIKKLKSKRDLSINCDKLEKKPTRICAYSDAGFAASRGQSSQIGYMALLADNTGKARILHWSSSKCVRVTRSVLGAELCALCDAMDFSAAIRKTIESMLGKKAPLCMFEGSKSLFDTVAKRSQISEKRLLIDLATLRDACRRHEMTNIGFMRAERNIADPLTKDMDKPMLDKMLETGYLDHPTEQWIMADKE